ncbi:MAG: hypothetical protein HYU36_10920 [Planctomycetes bacterium]|nr:hypothetical protein [Planctomycetota bacterium]
MTRCPNPASFIRIAILLALFAAQHRAAHALEVEIAFVTVRDGRRTALEPLHELRRSPYGGWVASFWPFGMKVNDTPILEFEEGLLQQAAGEIAVQAQAGGAAPSAEWEIKDDAFDAEAGPPVLPGIRRPAAVKLNLNAGDYLIKPGDFRFSVHQLEISSDDPRVRMDKENHRIEVALWPIIIRASDGTRSQTFSASVVYGGADLVQGVLKPLEDPDEKKITRKSDEPQGEVRFRRICLFLPPSPNGITPYWLNGIPFTLDDQGKIKIAKTPKASLVGERVLELTAPATTATMHCLGLRWLNAAPDLVCRSGKTIFARAHPTGSSVLVLSATEGVESFGLSFGTERKNDILGVSVPNTFAQRPFKTLVIDAQPRRASAYLVETADYEARPGQTLTLHVRAIAGRDEALAEASFPCHLEAAPGTAGASPPTHLEMPLARTGDGVFSGPVPAATPPGFWQIRAQGNSGLAGTPLALLHVTDQENPRSVSLYTYRNRAAFRRGDPVDLYWTVRSRPGSGPAGDFELALTGPHGETPLARCQPPAAALATGHLRLETSGLGPGVYTVSVRPQSLIAFPARFSILQREPVTDFETYAHAPFCEALPDAGNALTAYYAMLPDGGIPLGLIPLAGRVCGNLDAAFGSYSAHPVGPALEKCVTPDEAEVALMGLASIGQRAVPSMPVMLHHEEWNPKHSLPEELQRLRRRVALLTQKYADLAGFGGVRYNWYATLGGYWEESPAIDGHQGRRNAAAQEWVQKRVAERVEAEKKQNPDPRHIEIVQQQAGYEAWSLVLPNAYAQYHADASVIRPDATFHSSIPAFWLGNSGSYPPLAFSTLTRRDAVDYTDYGRSPWSSFRVPAFLSMDNPSGQRTQAALCCTGRHARFLQAFMAAGRGLDGFALTSPEFGPFKPSVALESDHVELLRIFERFGSYFRALDPLPDVAVYFSKSSPWPNQKNIMLHDLARLRRPGMLLGQEDVLRSGLKRYKILFLAAIGGNEPRPVLEAFAAFEKAGGVILRDRTCAEGVPGRDIGFAYDGSQVHGGWGLGGPDGRWEFAHLWDNFNKTREPLLLKAFEGLPPIPVSTSDKQIVISPLAGQESICCFVFNHTYTPVGDWTYQHVSLPRKGDLLAQDGWFVRDLLEGKPCETVRRDGLGRVEMDFSRAEGKIYWLSRRDPQSIGLRSQRIDSSPPALRVQAWLADAGGQPLRDPAPFEVTLAGPDGHRFFHQFAAIGPDRALDVPLPALPEGTRLRLETRDLVLGCSAVQEVAGPGMQAVRAEPGVDVVGLPQIHPFLAARPNRVLILLDEAQAAYRPAADLMADLLQKRGRKAKILTLDAAEVRELPLRWVWQEEDQTILDGLAAGGLIASRVDLAPWQFGKEMDFSRPVVGYEEYGPRLWIDGDAVLFGRPEENRALQDLDEFLRRRPSPSFPAPGEFFLHYVWDPFLGECDALYIGCQDPAGAEAAVRYLAALQPAGAQDAPAPPGSAGGQPQTTTSREARPLENMLAGKIGTEIIDVAMSPTGKYTFVSVDSYGDAFFALDSSGRIAHQRPVLTRFGRNVWNRRGGGLRPIADEQVFIDIWGTDYLLDLQKGFVQRTAPPDPGLPGGHTIKILAPVLLPDPARNRTFLGGQRRVIAVNDQGQRLWTYRDDEAHTGTEFMLYRRSLFFHGLSPNGRRLIASAFGIETDVYRLGNIRNQSVLCFDAETGKALWEKDGLLLNAGKAVLTDDRVLIVDDDARFHLFQLDSGEVAGQLQPARGTDIILPLPGSEYLLIVENNAYDEQGPSCRAYLRAPGDRPDVHLAIPGRVKHALLTPDGQKIILASLRGFTACFSTDGKPLWQSPVPAGARLAITPNGKTVLAGSGEGTLFWIDAETGKVGRTLDFNPFNLCTPEQYVERQGSVGDVPVAQSARVPPEPPESSYLESLDASAVPFGPNLVPPEKLLALIPKGNVPAGDPAQPKSLAVLDRPVEFKLAVSARTTYLVEFLDASAAADRLTPQTRVEIAVQSQKQSPHLPFSARLPIGNLLTRRRMAFRTGESDREVAFSLRVVVPSAQGGYSKAETSPMPMLLGDLVVAAMKFQSRSFLHEERQALSGSAPNARGSVKCEVAPWSGGANLKHWWPYEAPQLSFRVVDGLLGNQDTSWHETKGCPGGGGVAYATASIAFKKPEKLVAIAVFEDNQGPSVSGGGVTEWLSPFYAVFIHEAKTGSSRRVGYVINNTNLVNVFTFPAVEVDTALYYWAGRDFVHVHGGTVRMAEIEAYGTEEGELELEKPVEEDKEGEEEGEIEMKD